MGLRGSTGEMLRELPERETQTLVQAANYGCGEVRQGYRSSYYGRNLTTASGASRSRSPT